MTRFLKRLGIVAFVAFVALARCAVPRRETKQERLELGRTVLIRRNDLIKRRHGFGHEQLLVNSAKNLSENVNQRSTWSHSSRAGTLEPRGSCLSTGKRKTSNSTPMQGPPRPRITNSREPVSSHGMRSQSTSRTLAAQSTASFQQRPPSIVPTSVRERIPEDVKLVKPPKVKSRLDSLPISSGLPAVRIGPSESLASFKSAPRRSISVPAFERSWSDPGDRDYGSGSSAPRGRIGGARIPRLGSNPSLRSHGLIVSYSTQNFMNAGSSVGDQRGRPTSQPLQRQTQPSLLKRGACMSKGCTKEKSGRKMVEVIVANSPPTPKPLRSAMRKSASPSLKRIATPVAAAPLPRYRFNTATGRLQADVRRGSTLELMNWRKGLDLPRKSRSVKGRKSVSFHIPENGPEIMEV